MNRRHYQQGIGLIEALIALVLLVFAASVTSQMQTSSLVSAQGSSVHFSVDHLSNEMLTTLRAQASDAQAGLFDSENSTDLSINDSAEVVAWNRRIQDAIPTGIGTISCLDSFCDVSISWLEEIDGSDHRQFFRTRTPL